MKKSFKYLFRALLVVIVLGVAALYLTDNEYILRGIRLTYLKGRTTAGIHDYTDFDNRVILSGNPQTWKTHPQYNKVQLTDTLRQELEMFDTTAFAVFKEGKLFYEEYWDDTQTDTKSNSFSMAKSVVAMLLFKAIENGQIKSLDQPITDFLPEFEKDKNAKSCTVGDLAAMTSGFDWEEDYYFPINPTAKAYLGDNIEEQMLQRHFSEPAGGYFEYLSGNTQLLAIVLQRATGSNLSKNLSDYFWKPLGMEQDALWSLDGNAQMEKAYCCINATAHDFGKLGQLFLQKGNWNGKQLLDTLSVEKMTTPNFGAFSPDERAYYGYSFWIDDQYQPSFYAMLGHLGQRIIVIPDKQIVIVRLGHRKDRRFRNRGVLNDVGNDIYYYVDEVCKMTP